MTVELKNPAIQTVNSFEEEAGSGNLVVEIVNGDEGVTENGVSLHG